MEQFPNHLTKSETNEPTLLSPELLSMLRNLARLFRVDLDEPTILVYCRALSDLPIRRLKLGFDAALKRCKRMPYPADIRELANEQTTIALAESSRSDPPAYGKYCIDCYPDGYVLIPHPKYAGYKVAKHCPCQVRA